MSYTYEQQTYENNKIHFLTCPACEEITPQYISSEHGFNCIYPKCVNHIPFKKIIKMIRMKKLKTINKLILEKPIEQSDPFDLTNEDPTP